jgi:hypothetical protein
VVSALFFVISELASIEPMYQYSLAWFVALFEDTLAKADKARDLGKRIDNLVAHFQYSLYVQVSSALTQMPIQPDVEGMYTAAVLTATAQCIAVCRRCVAACLRRTSCCLPS